LYFPAPLTSLILLAQILSWFTKLRCSNSTASAQTDAEFLQTFCSMSVLQWYRFSVLMARVFQCCFLLLQMALPEEAQTLVGAMLQMAEFITDSMTTILPAVSQLQTYLRSIEDLNLLANNEFHQMSRGQRSSISTQATFVTLSRALCSNGILALFGISQLPVKSESDPSSFNTPEREEMIERFKLPRNATPFCMNMYLDMVNTTGGAIAWAFLKPMLMGQILYTPDTPTTRAIMEKANDTLQEFADLRKHSQEWLRSSKYIVDSAKVLGHTLPMLQNSLGNSFVKNFIEMQTDINVGRMKETLSTFSNMTLLLEKNKHILKQISALSTLMVDLSSCIKFDRYRGYDSADQLNAEAQALAKSRDLYASVIFKSSSSNSTLPPRVSYTIRMHMDNVMRTDRVRNPYFVKDSHISSRLTMRYNRGFVYLQENIDRAIIEIHAGHKVTDLAVQIQPFPYPCYFRDAYLEAISFVFPIMLMIAWVLFVADFVKKLVHERELRLHEYMKMMGVNPFSHFFAWFLECTFYLVLTIFILTMLLKYGKILPHSDASLIFVYFCDYGLSIIAFSYMVSSFFDKTYIAGLSGSLLYILCFFPFIVVMAMETGLTFVQKSLLSLFSPTCFSYASQYASRYESQGEGIHWSNSYVSPIAEDTSSFGWLCWLMLIDSILYFIIGAYIRMVFPGKYGIPAPWYFPFQRSFWADLCCCFQSQSNKSKGLFFSNIIQSNQPVFSDDKGKSTTPHTHELDFSDLPVGVALHGLTKLYGNQAAIENLNVSFYEGHVTSLLGHNGAGKTTTMSLLTGLFAPSSGTIEVYGRDMQANIDKIRKELGVCMQYDVLFDHMTTKEHLLLYGQIKAPHWSPRELREQVRTILEETGMYAHRHKRVGTLSGGMKRKLSISIAFIGGSRLVVLDEPTTGVDPCSRRSIWDIVIQHKKHRTIIMSTHHLDEAEVLSDRIAFLERGGLKCCGSPFDLKDKLGQGYKLTLTKKTTKASESRRIDDAELKSFIQAHVPEARLKDTQGGDLVYSLPPFTSSNASTYRSLLTALDSNLDALQLGGYGISDTTLEEVFLQLTHNTDGEDGPLSISETVSDSASIDSFPSDLSESIPNFGDKIKLTSSSTVSGLALAWQQMTAILIKRFHHSRRDYKGLISQILLPVIFVVFAMGLGSIKNDLQHYPELELSPGLYNLGPSYSFFSNQNPSSNRLVDRMMSFPGIDNACLDKSNDKYICDADNFQPPHRSIPSSQVVYNLSGINVETYLVATANDFIRNRYGGFAFGSPLPPDLQMDVKIVPKNRTLSKVLYNPEGHHTMPAYLNSLNNLILRANLPADKDPRKYAISVSSHPYFGRADDEDAVVQGMLQILVAMCVLTGYSIMTASFAIYEVNEHHSGSKRLQHIAGISEPFYWTVNFIYDMTIYMIPVTLTVAVIAIFQIPAFTYRQNLAAVTLLLVLFGFSTFPWMYLLSGFFKDAEMAFITYVCLNLFLSINTIISTSILHFISQISQNHPEVRMNCLCFFNFGNGMLELARMNINVQLLLGYGVDAYKDPFSTDALGWMFISAFIQGLFFFSLRLLLNKSLIRKVRSGERKKKRSSLLDQDEDVATEHLRVSSGAASSDILQVNQLTKVYQHFKRKIPAVKRLSVGIPAGECFGLLGVNGAGKTTTFKMLTGDVSPTDGSAQIRDWEGRLVDIMECRNKGINIGYCPQQDALDHLLTGEEHLYFYARIRGISKKQIRGVVNYLLKRLELNFHRNIITDGYSCGTRRKLSTALALVGHPQILLLDEPSSGMDPRTKRHLWKIITEEVKGKCAVVLTSHSMEECEALCSRLAIMVKGQFQCLGSLQHIKNRFGSGFTVKMYLAEASCDAEAITGFMQGRFPSTYLKDQHSAMVEYHVPFAPGGVADIFYQLESNKNALRIKHFSVSQTTLDEVFINFAMGKNGMKTIAFDSEDEQDDLDTTKAVQT
uniref:ATP-binding cassette, sub-family A (ABC1), member 12 n=1 Tax=Salarias fasciatus TaxID=181472 RepID=A0A672GNR9_SALFA